MTSPTTAAPLVPMAAGELVTLYREMLLPRIIEEKMLNLLRQGRLSKWFSGIGQEAIAVGVTHALDPDDWILPMHRNLGVWTTRGIDLDRLFCQLLGREGGVHERPRPHVPLRLPAGPDRRHDQPPRRHDPPRRRPGPRRPAAGRGPCRRVVHR